MLEQLLAVAGAFLSTYWLLILIIGFGIEGLRKFVAPRFWQGELGKGLSYFLPVGLGGLVAMVPGVIAQPVFAQKVIYGMGVGIFTSWAFPALKKGLLRPLGIGQPRAAVGQDLLRK